MASTLGADFVVFVVIIVSAAREHADVLVEDIVVVIIVVVISLGARRLASRGGSRLGAIGPAATSTSAARSAAPRGLIVGSAFATGFAVLAEPVTLVGVPLGRVGPLVVAIFVVSRGRFLVASLGASTSAAAPPPSAPTTAASRSIAAVCGRTRIAGAISILLSGGRLTTLG